MTWAYPAYAEKFIDHKTKIYISATILTLLIFFHVVVPYCYWVKFLLKLFHLSNHLLKQVNDNLLDIYILVNFITIFPSDYFELIKIMESLDVMLGGTKVSLFL